MKNLSGDFFKVTGLIPHKSGIVIIVGHLTRSTIRNFSGGTVHPLEKGFQKCKKVFFFFFQISYVKFSNFSPKFDLKKEEKTLGKI